MKILLSGGGTLGSVTPLLAIYDIVKEAHPETRFLWVGTKRGPEKELMKEANIRFVSLSSGKFRRYLSLWNVVDIVRVVIGFFQSFKLLWKEQPNLCISAGGFISVPLHFAAWLLGVPTWIHQQDVAVGLANKLMAPFASRITTALEISKKSFSKRKTRWLGNPVRSEILRGSKEKAKTLFHLDENLPTVFATGGGTGSLRVNQLIVEAISHLKGFCQVIHLSGKERPQELVERAVKLFPFYQVHQFFTSEMREAYTAADIIISRGGFGTITEIAALQKPAILIPKGGHQEENVAFLAKAGAVIYVDEQTSDGNYLAKTIRKLLADPTRQQRLAKTLHAMMPAAEPEVILEIVENINESRNNIQFTRNKNQ